MEDEKFGKYAGPGLINAASIKDHLIDIKGGDLQGYKREKPGLDVVLAELASAMPTMGDAAGIHPDVYQGFKAKTELLAQIRALRPVVAKLHEVLCESEIFYEDAREGDIIRMAKSVLDAAHHQNKPALLAVFEKMLKYRSQYGEKAAASRRKNAQARANAPKPAPEGSPPAQALLPPSGKGAPLGADPEKHAADPRPDREGKPLAAPRKALEDARKREALPATPVQPRGPEEVGHADAEDAHRGRAGGVRSESHDLDERSRDG